jgi:gliding motility-associated-like protein
VATATVTNGVPGTGVYSGPGTNSQGGFNPNTAGVGNHTIRYLFTSDNGCQDSAFATIWVHAVPSSSFTAPAGICLDQSATFTDQSSIDQTVDVQARITTWTWNFGDGNPDVVYNNGQPFDKTFTASRSYNVTLTTTSNNGCKSSVFSKALMVHAVPEIDFTLPTGICMPGGQATFSNRTTINEATQISYLWNFGDGKSSTQVTGTNVYAAAQSYTVSLKATSAFGCVADSSKVLPASAFVNIPVAAFAVSTDKVCEGSSVNFTDQSTSSGTITAWDWSFGDGTRSTQQNPTKTYSKFGDYTATLTVTDNNGCKSAITSPGKVVSVRINPKIDAGPDLTADENTPVVLRATAANASELLFVWQPANLLSNPTILQPTYIATQDQDFVLTATDKDGLCTAQDAMKVKVLKKVVVPNAFSPNGDGINDVWIIRNLPDYPDASVKIFDRYGQVVFESKGYSKPWDGTMQGRPLPVGTYYYIIHVKAGEKPLQGSITIIR